MRGYADWFTARLERDGGGGGEAGRGGSEADDSRGVDTHLV